MNAARCLTRTAKRWRSRFPWKSVPALISQGTVQPLFFSSTISLSHFIVVLQGADHFKACIWAARIPVRYESCISVCCEEKVFFMMILFFPLYIWLVGSVINDWRCIFQAHEPGGDEALLVKILRSGWTRRTRRRRRPTRGSSERFTLERTSKRGSWSRRGGGRRERALW